MQSKLFQYKMENKKSTEEKSLPWRVGKNLGRGRLKGEKMTFSRSFPQDLRTIK